ncbi:MAG: hypothetical protein ACYTGL_29960 [Planctomycetota bacterium]|jgi:hypothetical protein
MTTATATPESEAAGPVVPVDAVKAINAALRDVGKLDESASDIIDDSILSAFSDDHIQAITEWVQAVVDASAEALDGNDEPVWPEMPEFLSSLLRWLFWADELEDDESNIAEFFAAIRATLTLTGTNWIDAACWDGLCSLKQEERDEIEAWIDDVAAEDAEHRDAERPADWPIIPTPLARLLNIDGEEAPAQPRAETREEAVRRLEGDLSDRLHELRAAESEYAAKDRSAKAAKKAMEAAQSALNATASELDEALHGSFQPRLPFPPDEAGATTSEPEAEPVEPSSKDPAIEAPLSELGLSGSLTGKLESADIDTVAELEGAMSKDRLRKIQGVGPSAIDKISDAVINWRNEHGYGSKEETEPSAA